MGAESIGADGRTDMTTVICSFRDICEHAKEEIHKTRLSCPTVRMKSLVGHVVRVQLDDISAYVRGSQTTEIRHPTQHSNLT